MTLQEKGKHIKQQSRDREWTEVLLTLKSVQEDESRDQSHIHWSSLESLNFLAQHCQAPTAVFSLSSVLRRLSASSPVVGSPSLISQDTCI